MDHPAKGVPTDLIRAKIVLAIWGLCHPAEIGFQWIVGGDERSGQGHQDDQDADKPPRNRGRIAPHEPPNAAHN